MRKHHARLLLSALECRLVPTVTWDGGGGDHLWSTATNWSANKLPTATDDVVIANGAGTVIFSTSSTIASIDCQTELKMTSGNLTINSVSKIEQLTNTGAVLDGFGDVSVITRFDWSGGSMTGTGKLALAAGATGTVSGNNTRYLGRVLENSGLLTYSGSGWNFGNGTAGTLSNLPGATFTASGDGDFGSNGPGGTITNAGTFVRTGLGVTNVDGGVSFNSTGPVNVLGGTLRLTGGGALSGTAVLSAGAALEVGGGSVSLNSGAAVSGAGFLAVTSGSLVASANATAVNYVQTGGSLDGGAVLTVNGSFDWSGGSMTGTGKLALAAGATGTVSGNNTRYLGRVLENSGLLTYSGSGWNFGNGTAGTLSNLPGATFTASGDGDFGSNGPGGTITNAGTFVRTGIGSSNVNAGVNFQNTGKLQVDSGALTLSGGFLNYNGTAIVAGSYLLTGILQFNTAKLVYLPVVLTLNGTGSAIVDQSGNDAIATLTSVAAGGALNILNGRALTLPSMTMNGSVTVGQTSTLQVNGAYNQNGGVTTVDGSFSATSSLTLAAGILKGSGVILSDVNNTGGTNAPGSSPGILTVGNYVQSGSLSVELNGPAVGTEYDQLNVNGACGLGGNLNVSMGYGAKVNDSFVIVNNDAADLVSGSFAGLNQGDNLSAKGYQLQIDYQGGTGNDVVLKVVSIPSPPATATVQINGGDTQRSRVTNLKVTFNTLVTLPANPIDAFQLKRQSDNVSVSLGASVVGNSVTLTFTGGPLDFGSLADGRYTLTAFASQINGGNFDGNGDGIAGDDYVLTGSPSNGLFRLFGDADGNGVVNAADFLAFRSAFGGTSFAFDFNNSGTVDSADFLAFRSRFGASV